MSVVVIVRFPSGAPGKAVEWARAHSDIPEEITAHAKTLGQIGHRILVGDKELVVIDEWPDEESFNTFFSGAPRMDEFLSGAGLSAGPVVSVLQAVDAPGTFWT
jgi:hypothetical protein